MTWIQATPAIIAAVVVVLAPGYIAAWIAGFAPATRLVTAAPLSLGAVGVAAIANMVVPFRWTPLAWGVSVVVLWGLAAVVRRLDRGSTERSQRNTSVHWWILAATLFAFVMLAFQLMRVITDPANISQTFDNVYHLNGVRWVEDSGQIAPTRQLLPGFYPSLWHAVTATVAMLTGSSVPVAVNAVSIALAAFIWPVSLIGLVTRLAGCRPAAIMVAGVMSATIPLFPLLLLNFGVLYPNALSIALLPAVLVSLLFVLGSGSDELARPGRWSRWALLLLSTGTLALAHPSSFIALLIFGGLAVVARLTNWMRGEGKHASPARRWQAVLAVAALAITSLALFVVARPAAELAFWPPTRSAGDGAFDVLSLALVGRPAAWALAVLAIVGIIAILVKRRDLWWLVASYGVLGLIYFVCVAGPHNRLRDMLSGTWYNDANRIAALFPVLLIPIVAIGVAIAVRGVTDRARPSARVLVHTVVGTSAVVVVAGAVMLNPAIGAEERSMTRIYVQTPEAPLLNTDERALLARLAATVPESDVIAGSPWTGTSLAYALSDREVLLTNIFDAVTPDKALIISQLDQAQMNPAVCSALERERVRWVLDFGADGVHVGSHPYPGLENAGPEVLELVDSEGAAKLYRIIACDA